MDRLQSPPAAAILLAEEPFTSGELASIEKRTVEIGHSLFDQVDLRRPRFYDRAWWDDKLMAASMRDAGVKVELFRFVDALPMLNESGNVYRHITEYLQPVHKGLPWGAWSALKTAGATTATKNLVSWFAKTGARSFARRFIAGSNLKEVLQVAKDERSKGRAFTLDILGEAVTSSAEAEKYFKSYLELIEKVSPVVNSWPESQKADMGVDGPLPRMNLSVKLSALDAHFDPIDPDRVARNVGARLAEILRLARRNKAYVHVDMESYEKKDLTLHIFKKVLGDAEFRDFPNVGIVIQCYLTDSGKDLVELRDWARQRGTPVWVRLVKGAYWEHESVLAQANGWPIPVYRKKWETDDNYERQTRFLLHNHRYLRPALGSHNLRSMAHAIATSEHLNLPKAGFEFQMLYGMATAEKEALQSEGYRMRVYMPYGELIPGMAYLVRRLLENTSNDSFLRAGLDSKVSRDRLLARPADIGKDTIPAPTSESDMNAPITNPLKATFPNHPPTDFAEAKNREAMQRALAEVKTKLGRHFPLVIADRPVETEERLKSVDPSFKDRVVGYVASATVADADKAVAAAKQAFIGWAGMTAAGRADILRKLAQQMRDRYFELSAWEVYECAKGWREATADIDEAIDFCEFYAQGAIEMEQARGADAPGEQNRFEYIPRGVAAIIAPWNFPLAILTGMTAAALATGNTAIMKPAEQSSVIAGLMMEMCQAAGFPPGVVNFLPGKGETCGARLVEHPDVAIIAFTGSRPVGMAINAKAAAVSANLSYVKRVIAEMGGKNAVIVDDDADLDEAVMGVVKSAFGFQGQKCSACSRAIILDSVYDQFVPRLVESAKSLIVGPAEDPSTNVGPVIDEAAREKVLEYVAIGKAEGREAFSADVGKLAEQGYFVGPHVFADIKPTARLAQEEIFGPILALIRVKTLDEAIKVANDTQYALTAGIFSRSPAHLERAKRELLVGNLYINRSITGALVGRQPFGGFKMSGIGSKAGGPDYLLQFVLPRTITENTMRRGFTPDLEA
jgi:RHH-type proline utilization regulon transcriptional repressor/proline dehydrogenase/delta 1-pyrroline-5-carboxylate dehydrogenase